jgi:hypothetical protein
MDIREGCGREEEMLNLIYQIHGVDIGNRSGYKEGVFHAKGESKCMD